jgi:hypothetical protein
MWIKPKLKGESPRSSTTTVSTDPTWAWTGFVSSTLGQDTLTEREITKALWTGKKAWLRVWQSLIDV